MSLPWAKSCAEGEGLQVKLPAAAKDLIQRLMCDVDDRLGTHGGAAEIKVCFETQTILVCVLRP